MVYLKESRLGLDTQIYLGEKMHRVITYGLPILALATVGLIGDLTSNTATQIATVIMVVAPFVLKFVPLDGPKMALVSMATAIAVAVGAGFYTGEVTTSSFNLQNLATTSAALWAVSQVVFQLFKNNKTFGTYLK